MSFRLTNKADSELLYELELQRYGAEKMEKFCTKEYFIRVVNSVSSIGFEKDGRPIGGAAFFNHEIHFAVLPEFHGRWAVLARPMWEWMFRQEDPVVLRVEKDNEKCLNFMDRSKWPRIGSDDTYILFRASSDLLPPHRKQRIDSITSDTS